MRPRHRCRGRHVWFDTSSTVLAASMRPRHRCRGRRARIRLHRRRLGTASMRPRHRCRGRHRNRVRLRAGGFRFNEAAASMPRKTLAALTDTVALAGCFNEAAASMPRKTTARWCHRRATSPASMRPRHRCRGRRRRLTHRKHDASRCFNEAAASMPRKTSTGRAPGDMRTARFNEAAASMPRKTVVDATHIDLPNVLQ